jgi:hypothetical protein
MLKYVKVSLQGTGSNHNAENNFIRILANYVDVQSNLVQIILLANYLIDEHVFENIEIVFCKTQLH